jgi:hypothetical protein
MMRASVGTSFLGGLATAVGFSGVVVLPSGVSLLGWVSGAVAEGVCGKFGGGGAASLAGGASAVARLRLREGPA